MTVTGGTVVAFSAVRSMDGSKMEGSEQDMQKPSPMMMQVSMVTMVARPMSMFENDKAIEFIMKSKDVIMDTYKNAKEFYDKNEKTFTRIKLGFKAVQGVGEIIGGIMQFFPDKEDPMVQRLADLETDVKRLSEKLSQNFGEMKAFISEQAFLANIMSPTMVLTKYMRDCLKRPGDDSKANFERTYEKKVPLTLLYNLKNYLKQKTTNPLKLSMDAEKVKTKATFDKWEDIICRVMTQFLFLEAFANGLSGSKDETNLDRIIETSIEIIKEMDSWRDEYKNDQEYWKELKNDFEKYFVDHTNLNNIQKGEALKKRIDNYLTHDAFYICVFNATKSDTDYTIYCPNANEQLIGSWNKGRCCAFVYRSRRGAKIGQASYDKLKGQVRECEDKLSWKGSLTNIIKDQLVNTSIIPNYGFYCLMGSMHCDPQIYFLNSPTPEWYYKGPGHLTKILMNKDGGKQEYDFIVSFN